MYARVVSHEKPAEPEPMDRAKAEEVARIMQALAAPSRVMILWRLSLGPASVSDLARTLELNPSAVSHQLRVLRLLRLVVGEREGRRVSYALHDPHVADMLEEAAFHTEHARLGLVDRPTGGTLQ